MDYAIQSNCPFESACVDNECKVACPIFYNTEYLCHTDSDCDCSDRVGRSKECICYESKCLSIE